MILPAQKYLRVIRGATFDYPFQFLDAIEGDTTPIPLNGYTATWTITYDGGQTVYSNVMPIALGGQFATLVSQVGAIQIGAPGSTATGRSGVIFGGTGLDLSTGQIDMLITATDTANIPWTNATYLLEVTNPLGAVLPLMEGALAVV